VCIYFSLSLFLSLHRHIYSSLLIYSYLFCVHLSNHLIDWCVFIYLSHWSQKSQCSKLYAMDGMGWWTMHKNDFWQKIHNWRWKSSTSVNSKWFKMSLELGISWHIWGAPIDILRLQQLGVAFDSPPCRNLWMLEAWKCRWPWFSTKDHSTNVSDSAASSKRF
jgi:hypothetical protein